MTYKSNLPQITARLRQARSAGLVAAAEVVIGRVKEGLRGGYTSGAFVTGNVLNSVNRSEPMEDERGAHILVGTDVDYALYWEVGHQNIFTRRFERKEVWVPALFASRAEATAAFQRVFQRAMGGGGGGFGQRAASPRSPDA
jgi:hypothetical protein